MNDFFTKCRPPKQTNLKETNYSLERRMAVYREKGTRPARMGPPLSFIQPLVDKWVQCSSYLCFSNWMWTQMIRDSCQNVDWDLVDLEGGWESAFLTRPRVTRVLLVHGTALSSKDLTLSGTRGKQIQNYPVHFTKLAWLQHQSQPKLILTIVRCPQPHLQIQMETLNNSSK